MRKEIQKISNDLNILADAIETLIEHSVAASNLYIRMEENGEEVLLDDFEAVEKKVLQAYENIREAITTDLTVSFINETVNENLVQIVIDTMKAKQLKLLDYHFFENLVDNIAAYLEM